MSQIKPVAFEKNFQPRSLFLLKSGSNNPHYDRRRRRAACVEQIKDEEDTKDENGERERERERGERRESERAENMT